MSRNKLSADIEIAKSLGLRTKYEDLPMNDFRIARLIYELRERVRVLEEQQEKKSRGPLLGLLRK